MSSEATDGDLPPTKRARLDQDASAVATDTTSAVAATTVLAPASATASAVGEQVAAPSDPFSFEHETGLFKTLKDSLGRRAATEEEVGVTEYADSSVPPFAGIIKHRSVTAGSIPESCTRPLELTTTSFSTGLPTFSCMKLDLMVKSSSSRIFEDLSSRSGKKRRRRSQSRRRPRPFPPRRPRLSLCQ